MQNLALQASRQSVIITNDVAVGLYQMKTWNLLHKKLIFCSSGFKITANGEKRPLNLYVFSRKGRHDYIFSSSQTRKL